MEYHWEYFSGTYFDSVLMGANGKPWFQVVLFSIYEQ